MGLTAEGIFERLDADQNKAISVAEFARSPGIQDEKEAREAAGRIDTDGDGTLSWPEFAAAHTQRHADCPKTQTSPVPEGRGDLTRFAQVFILRNDRNGDGKVDKSEFRGSRERFDQMDKNRNGQLDPEELAELHARRMADPKTMRERLQDGDAPRPPTGAARLGGRAMSMWRTRGFVGVLCLAAGALLVAGERPQGRDAEALARRQSEQFFARMDKNKDGKVSRDELPEGMRGVFDRVDRNQDGAITPDEDMAFRAARARQGGGRTRRPAPPEPDHANVKYGPHERNVLDLWLAKSDVPTPLVIYYHGGGFRGGDKRTLNVQLLNKLREAGVTVAAANYRLTNVAPFPAQMLDCARALQFLRLHAKDYNLDPKRVGATGGSAGAGISQWLAFHDDLADPKAEDPILRESTRISCAVVYAAQTSYDPRFIQKLFDTDKVDPALIAFFGMKDASDVADPKFHPLFREASMIDHATKDDAPVMLFYPQANRPLPPNSPGGQHIHHPKFGVVLKEKLDRLGVECIVKFREDCPQGAPIDDYVAFFLRHLGVKPKP